MSPSGCPAITHCPLRLCAVGSAAALGVSPAVGDNKDGSPLRLNARSGIGFVTSY